MSWGFFDDFYFEYDLNSLERNLNAAFDVLNNQRHVIRHSNIGI